MLRVLLFSLAVHGAASLRGDPRLGRQSHARRFSRNRALAADAARADLMPPAEVATPLSELAPPAEVARRLFSGGDARPIILYDGVCNLCNGFINFVADGDSQRKVKFGAQQKHMELLERVGAPTDLSTLVLIQGPNYYVYSGSALRTLALMDWPWKALSAAAIVPWPLRDFVYKLVAASRYTVFGKSDECRAPSGDFAARFIDFVEKPDADPIAGGGSAL